MITLPEDRSMPLYQALYLQLRQQIQSGALPYGKKLPSKRKLLGAAGHLGKHRGQRLLPAGGRGIYTVQPPARIFCIGRRNTPPGKGPRTCAAIPACRLRAQMDSGLLPLRHGAAAVSLWGLAEAHEELF